MTAPAAPPPGPLRRLWRALRRRRGPILFALAVTAGLAWVAWPHLSAGAAGLLAERRGHWVEWDFAVPEDRRRFAPLPAGAAVWRTPVAVAVNGRPFADPPPAPEPLSDALDRIARMPAVRDVSVSHCAVGAADARRLAAVHRGEDLDLLDCDLAPDVLATLAGRGGWEWLHLDGSSLPPGELATFAGGDGLRILSLTDARGVGGQVAAFAGHPGLFMIWASGTTFGDTDARAVAGCPRLGWFRAADTAVTDAGATALLRTAAPLRRLDLSGTAVTDAAFAALPDRPELTDLALARTGVTDFTVRRLAERCPQLERLDLSGTRVTDAALPHLARLTALRSLDLTGTGVTSAALQPALDWAALAELRVSDSLAPPGAPLRRWDIYTEGGPTVHFDPPAAGGGR